MIFYCPGCWAEVPEGSKRCPACGQSLEAGNEDFVDKLIAAIHHPEPTRAALAIQVLGEMLGEPRSILPLIDLLDTACDPYVLKHAVVALGRFADRRAVPSLTRLALNLETPLLVRTAAVDALARIGGKEAQVALHRALADPNSSVRDIARQALHHNEG
ncbi:MAG: HEAT repeat domain-containing protein [Anaerolineae bacterium]